MKNKTDLLYKELSYKIVGCLFDAYNNLGGGLKEKHYQNALLTAFKDSGINFKSQAHFPIDYKQDRVGRFYFDFLIEDKIILELKVGNRFKKQDIEQLYSYLKLAKLKLGLMANFTNDGVKCKRIVNLR